MSQIDPSSLGYRATRRRAFLVVLDRPCRTHHARAGQPCWTIPGAFTLTDVRAVCGVRVRTTLTKRGPR